MNFHDLKNKSELKSQERSLQENWEQVTAEAISNNPGIAELDELEQSIMRKAEVTALRKSLAISVENFNSLKMEQNQVISELKSLIVTTETKIVAMSESNSALEKVIKVAAGSSHKAAIEAIAEVQSAIKKELANVLSEAENRRNEREQVENIALICNLVSACCIISYVLVFFAKQIF